MHRKLNILIIYNKNIYCNPERGIHYLLLTALQGHAIISELVNFNFQG